MIMAWWLATERFETLKTNGGKAFAVTRHLRRLHHSLEALAIAAPDADLLRSAIDVTVQAGGYAESRIRVTVTAGSGSLGSGMPGGEPSVVVAVTELKPKVAPIAITVPWTRNERGATAGLKTTSYAENVRALRVAHQAGASEALFANTQDQLCEGTGTNVFVVVGGQVLTPPLSSGCLAGVSRELLLEAADIEERDLPFDRSHDRRRGLPDVNHPRCTRADQDRRSRACGGTRDAEDGIDLRRHLEDGRPMTTYVVLLRAINVGGRNKIPMADLRDLLNELKFTDVATYIQSGNVVCRSRKNATSVRASIKAGIADRFGHDIAVLVRSAAELEQIVAGFPYAEADPKSSGVVFLANEFGGELDASAFAPDECVVAGANVHVNCPTRFADTKLTAAWVEKQTELAGTRRNWATVLKLHAMASGDS